MSHARVQMIPPPSKPADPGGFEKLPRPKHHGRRPARCRPEEEEEHFTEEQARRAQWLIAVAVSSVLILGGLLVFAGM